MCAFYQILLSKGTMKYCGVATLFRGIRVYTKVSHGNSWLRECCRYIIVASWATSSRRDVQQSLLITCIVKTTHLKSLPPPGPTYCRPSASNQQLLWVGFFSQSVLSASPHRIAALTSCLPPESVKGLSFFIGIYKVFSCVVPYSAPTPIQPTLDCDWWFSN